MEDQQPAAGDLTDTGSPADGLTAARRRHRMPVGKAGRVRVTPETLVDPEAVGSTEESGATEGNRPAETDEAADLDDTDSPFQTPLGTGVFAERRPAGRRAPIAIATAAALFVGAAAFAGAALQPYLAERAQVATKFVIARTAADAIATLWTYTPENMESLGDRAAGYLGGDFEAQYGKYIDAIAPTNKQAQVTNNTQVVGVAVESVDGPDATVLVYTNSTATSPLSKDVPTMRYLSYRLTLRHADARWLVTKMSTITSLELTPQI